MWYENIHYSIDEKGTDTARLQWFLLTFIIRRNTSFQLEVSENEEVASVPFRVNGPLGFYLQISWFMNLTRLRTPPWMCPSARAKLVFHKFFDLKQSEVRGHFREGDFCLIRCPTSSVLSLLLHPIGTNLPVELTTISYKRGKKAGLFSNTQPCAYRTLWGLFTKSKSRNWIIRYSISCLWSRNVFPL